MTMQPVTFRGRAEKAIREGTVAATRVGAKRIAQLRRDAAADFEIFEAMRDQARAIRLHVLNNLDHYLGRFADNVEARGGRVHWAADAAEAEWRRVHQQRQAPSDLTEYTLSGPIKPHQLLVQAGLVASSSEGARLLRQGAVRLDGEPVDPRATISLEAKASRVLSVGSKRHVRIVGKD